MASCLLTNRKHSLLYYAVLWPVLEELGVTERICEYSLYAHNSAAVQSAQQGISEFSDASRGCSKQVCLPNPTDQTVAGKAPAAQYEAGAC